MKALVLPPVVLLVMGIVASNVQAGQVGEVAAVRGEVYLHRNLAISPALKEEPILDQDKVETLERSRAKLDFSDDSKITLSSNTVFNVLTYLEGRKGKKGSSVFELLDGKVKAVSGRNSLEIHTPTAVAAARGTYFFVRVRTVNGQVVTDIACLSGMVDVRNRDESVEGLVTVGAGKTTSVVQDEPPTEPVPIPPGLLKDAINCTPVASGEQRE